MAKHETIADRYSNNFKLTKKYFDDLKKTTEARNEQHTNQIKLNDIEIIENNFFGIE